MTEESLFAAALTRDDPAQRQAFLDEACGGDPFLRRRLGELLAAHEQLRGILDRDQDAAAAPVGLPPLLVAGQVFAGRYCLREKIGQGGMGEVWVADQAEPVRRRVALKVIRPELDSARQLSRFEAERQALALMDHPNIAKVLDGGVSGGRPFFVMDLIDGVPITLYCARARLSPDERLGLFVQVCQAVQHAHQKGVIHRDLKPSNVLVATYDGKPVPKVIDFGLAKCTGPRLCEHHASTEVGFVVGTPEYMSPEQADPNGVDVDTRSDVYALGVLLYELLTGSTPFSREQLQAVPFAGMLRILREVEPPRLCARLAEAETMPGSPAARQAAPKRAAARVRGELDWVVMKCLEKDRERRYESAGALAADVRRYLADEPVLARPPSVGYRLGKFVRRHRGPALAAALVLVALVAGIVGTTVGMVRAERARETAEKRLAQIEKGSDLLGAVFDDLDPRAEEKEGRPLRAILGERLDRAAAELEGEAVGDPLVVARLQARLGRTYLGLGHPAKAEALFAKAVATRRTALGADDPFTLASRRDHAEALRERGHVQEAIRCLEEVCDAQERRLGADHEQTLATLHDLGVAYRRAGEADRAVALLERVRDAWVRRRGPDDPDTLGVLNSLATAQHRAGKIPEAIDLSKQVYEATLKRYGPTHANSLSALSNLAAMYASGYRMRPGLALLHEARNAVIPKLGEDHPLSLMVLHNLANHYRVFGKTREAVALFEQVREKQSAVLGPGHPATLTTLRGLALAYRDSGDLDKAVPLFQQAAAGVERLGFAYDHADEIVASLCRCQERRKQYSEAEAWRRKWLAVVLAKAGPNSTAYAESLASLGSNLLQQGKNGDAEPHLRGALAIFLRKAPSAWDTSETQVMLGAALLGQGKHADAEPLLVQGCQGLQGWDARLGPSHGAITRQPLTEAMGRLVQLYVAVGKPAEAARWRKELEALGGRAEG